MKLRFTRATMVALAVALSAVLCACGQAEGAPTAAITAIKTTEALTTSPAIFAAPVDRSQLAEQLRNSANQAWNNGTEVIMAFGPVGLEPGEICRIPYSFEGHPETLVFSVPVLQDELLQFLKEGGYSCLMGTRLLTVGGPSEQYHLWFYKNNVSFRFYGALGLRDFIVKLSETMYDMGVMYHATDFYGNGEKDFKTHGIVHYTESLDEDRNAFSTERVTFTAKALEALFQQL